HNLRETLQDPTSHAELLALRWAAMDRGGWRLAGVTAYVTLEPCPMCAGALVNARISRVVYGCDDPKAGAVKTLFGIGQDPPLNPRFRGPAGRRRRRRRGHPPPFLRRAAGPVPRAYRREVVGHRDLRLHQRGTLSRSASGELSEWSKEPDSKSGDRASGP